MKFLATRLCAFVLLLAFPFAVNAAEAVHSPQDGQVAKTDLPQSHISQGGMMQGMMQGDKPMGGMGSMCERMRSHPYSDQTFLSAMIPHHEGAVAMAQGVLKNGKDPQVKKWAEEVIRAQASEIRDMQGWLNTMGGHDSESANMMKVSMHGMMASPMNADPDRNFVETMIMHHVGALEMATVSLEKSVNQNVLTLSKAVLESQAQEIYDYKQWLLKEK